MSRSRLHSSPSLSQDKRAHDLYRMMGAIGFPESSQRTTATQIRSGQPETEDVEDEDIEEGRDDRQEAMSASTFPSSPSPGINFVAFPHRGSPALDLDPSSRRASRSSMMRLENILNDVSIQDVYEPRPRSWSLGQSPMSEDKEVDETSIRGFTSSSLPETLQFSRSLSPPSRDTESMPVVKKKKVKMHRCPECQKEFPRPSGLRTHMNIHTKEKPFGCTYPGCRRTFSVVSNAKRHMRTHGLGVPVDDTLDQASVPYVVGFEAPMVVEPQPEEVARREQIPYRLRWMQGPEETPSSTQGFTSRSRRSSSNVMTNGDLDETGTLGGNGSLDQLASWALDSSMGVGEKEDGEGLEGRPSVMDGGKG